MIGFDDKVLERADLARAIGQDPVAFITGGHRADGSQQAPFDSVALTKPPQKWRLIFRHLLLLHILQRAISHEITARDILRESTGLPVTCSIELLALGGPRAP